MHEPQQYVCAIPVYYYIHLVSWYTPHDVSISPTPRLRPQGAAKTKINIIRYYNEIWNQHTKCINLSTNIPSIGLVIFEEGKTNHRELSTGITNANI